LITITVINNNTLGYLTFELSRYVRFMYIYIYIYIYILLYKFELFKAKIRLKIFRLKEKFELAKFELLRKIITHIIYCKAGAKAFLRIIKNSTY
jgi:hypothetical protein